MKRAILVAVVVLGVLGVFAASRAEPKAAAPFFTQLAPPGPPFVPTGDFVTSTWYCPGTPSKGSDGTSRFGGEVVVANPTDAPLTGRVRLLSDGQAPVLQQVSVAAHDRQTFVVDDLVTSDYASAVVELDGGRGIVEQKAIHPSGEAVASCANATSSDWYFADGFTVDGSTDVLVLTNPFPQAAIVDVTFGLEGGIREPSALQGLVVAPNSVRSIDLGARARCSRASSPSAFTPHRGVSSPPRSSGWSGVAGSATCTRSARLVRTRNGGSPTASTGPTSPSSTSSTTRTSARWRSIWCCSASTSR